MGLAMAPCPRFLCQVPDLQHWWGQSLLSSCGNWPPKSSWFCNCLQICSSLTGSSREGEWHSALSKAHLWEANPPLLLLPSSSSLTSIIYHSSPQPTETSSGQRTQLHILSRLQTCWGRFGRRVEHLMLKHSWASHWPIHWPIQQGLFSPHFTQHYFILFFLSLFWL